MAQQILPYSSWIALDFMPETYSLLTTTSSKYRPVTAARSVQDYICRCGNIVTKPSAAVKAGAIKSCGCLARHTLLERNSKHGKSRAPEYKAYHAMLNRCYNPKASHFDEYGGRGIGVWDTWRGPGGFELWFTEIGPRPSKLHSQDRIEVDGNYEPGNIRWATKEEQMNNMRSNVLVQHLGEYKTLAQWEQSTGIPARTIDYRIKEGWTPEKALTVPVIRKNKLHEHNGEARTLKGWASFLGIPYPTISTNIAKGLTISDIMKTKRRNRK